MRLKSIELEFAIAAPAPHDEDRGFIEVLIDGDSAEVDSISVSGEVYLPELVEAFQAAESALRGIRGQ